MINLKTINIGKIAIIGAGSWGSALAILLSGKFRDVWLWGHDSKHVDSLRVLKENKRYLPGVKFPETLHFETSLADAVKNASLIVMVVPSHVLRDVFKSCLPYVNQKALIVSAIKGIENGSMKTMVQVMEEEINAFGNGIANNIECGVLSGPSFAKEVAEKAPTAVTVGFNNINTAKIVQKIFNTEFFRVYSSTDVIGLEISAALKNIIAIATGICDGIGYGLNTRAALITRGLAEMTRFGKLFNAEESTFSGLSGMGDLILTCTGDLSRNREVGLKLGQGKNIEQVKSEMKMVAEGIKTTKSVYQLAQLKSIDMPILQQIYEVIYLAKDCKLAVKDLLSRELKEE